MLSSCLFFFFNDTATTEIYTLSLHDALPIPTQTTVRRAAPDSACAGTNGSALAVSVAGPTAASDCFTKRRRVRSRSLDRKSTRLNSSHLVISYAVFCLKKKKKIQVVTLCIKL